MFFVHYTRAAVFCRYGILMLLVLPLLGVYTLASESTLLASILIVESHLELLSVSLLHSLMAGCGIAVIRTVLFNAHARFQDCDFRLDPKLHWSWILGWCVLGMAFPISCLLCSAGADGLRSSLVFDVLIIMCGAVASVIILAVVGECSRILFGTTPDGAEVFPWESHVFLRFNIHRATTNLGITSFFENWGGPGYVLTLSSSLPTGQRQVSHGHRQLIALLLVVGCFYLIGYRVIGWVGPEHSHMPVASYAIVVLMFIGLLLAGAAFFLDYYRLPVPLVVFFAYMLTRQLYLVDHFYELKSAPANPPLVPVVEYLDALSQPSARPIPNGPHGRTAVVITAAGGGIQANAWTARVLTGLHQRYGTDFTDSVIVVSGVSGGSVGTMHYLSQFDNLRNEVQGAKSTPVADGINTASRANGLVATGYGLAGHDLLRAAVPSRWLAPSQLCDRGWELQQFWQRQMKSSSLGPHETIRGLTERVMNHQIPLPIFNATLADTGQRLMISPVYFNSADDNKLTVTEPIDFVRRYEDSDLALSTAARLSANFSYVSPICRPRKTDGTELTDGWVADGGYVDNEGMVSVVKFLEQVWGHFDDPNTVRPFDRIVVIRILAFPEEEEIRDDVKQIGDVRVPFIKSEDSKVSLSESRAAATAGWWQAVLGPVNLLNRVRVTSQAERGQLELDLMEVLSSAAVRDYLTSNEPPRVAITAEDAPPINSKPRLESSPPGSPKSAISQALKFQKSKHEDGAKRILAHRLAVESEPNPDSNNAPKRPLEIVSAKLVFPAQGSRSPPLSWRLTKSQQADIDNGWKLLEDSGTRFITPICFEWNRTLRAEELQPTLSLDELFGKK